MIMLGILVVEDVVVVIILAMLQNVAVASTVSADFKPLGSLANSQSS